MALVPQALPWTVLPGREIGDGNGNIVQYTQANLGLICLAVNAHDRLIGTLNQVETWLRSDPVSRCSEAQLLDLVSLATGRLGYGALASKIEDALSSSPDLDRAISVELQTPEAAYTASIDAALQLVPQGWAFGFTTQEQYDPVHEHNAFFMVVELKSAAKTVTATSRALPLAIAAAALKTKET